MGTPDCLTCLLGNLYAGQEATVRTPYRTTDWFRIEKFEKAVYCNPVYLIYMQRKSCKVGPDALISVYFSTLKLALSPYSFTLIRRLFSSSLLSAIRVVSVYLRLFIFLQAILIPACNSSSLAFFTVCSAYSLNKQGDSRQLCGTSFSILN